MFNIRAVRERVSAKLNVMRNVSEETIHAVYSEEIQRELETAREVALSLRGNLDRACQGHTADKSFYFVRLAEWMGVDQHITKFVEQFR